MGNSVAVCAACGADISHKDKKAIFCDECKKQRGRDAAKKYWNGRHRELLIRNKNAARTAEAERTEKSLDGIMRRLNAVNEERHKKGLPYISYGKFVEMESKKTNTG